MVTERVRNHGMHLIGSFQIGFGATDESSMADSVAFGKELALDVYNYHAAVPPIKQMMDPAAYAVSPDFRIWNNDPCLPPNLYGEYDKWHQELYGIPITMGRHTPMKLFLNSGNIKPFPSAYQLDVGEDAIARYLEKAMGDGRESNEYQLFQKLGLV